MTVFGLNNASNTFVDWHGLSRPISELLTGNVRQCYGRVAAICPVSCDWKLTANCYCGCYFCNVKCFVIGSVFLSSCLSAGLLWSPYGIGQAVIFLPCDFYLLLSFFFSSPNLSGRRLDVYHAYFHTWCGLSANLECMSEMCCTRLGENTGREKSPCIGTIAQLCRAVPVSSQLRHVSTIAKKTC